MQCLRTLCLFPHNCYQTFQEVLPRIHVKNYTLLSVQPISLNHILWFDTVWSPLCPQKMTNQNWLLNKNEILISMKPVLYSEMFYFCLFLSKVSQTCRVANEPSLTSVALQDLCCFSAFSELPVCEVTKCNFKTAN